MSHVNIHFPHRFSRYGVDIYNLERVEFTALHRAGEQGNLVVTDEISEMELFSDNFREAAMQIFDSCKRVLGTIILTMNP